MSAIIPRDDRIARFFALPDALQQILNFIHAGKFMTEIGALLDIPSWIITKWIAENEERDHLVKKAIAYRQENFWPELILKETIAIATNDPRTLFDENGNILPPNRWPDKLAACISRIEQTETTRENGDIVRSTKIHFWNKNQALELAAKISGLTVDKVEHGISQTLEDLIVASRQPKLGGEKK